MKYKKNASIIISLVLFLLFLPFISLISGSKIRNFFMRELSYSIILRKITNKPDSDIIIANKIFKFVCENVEEPNKFTMPIDSNPFEVLMCGKGSCDQQSNLIITLGSIAGIKGYLIYLYTSKSNTSTHSICMIKTKKNTIIFDPFYRKKIDHKIFSKIRLKNKKLLFTKKHDIKTNMCLKYDSCIFIKNDVAYIRKIFRRYAQFWVLCFDKTLFKNYLNMFFLLDHTNFIKKKRICTYLNN